jgi:hypothetical protein
MTKRASFWLLRSLPLAGLLGSVELILRVATGRGIFAHARGLLASRPEHVPVPPSDPLDEAIWESFPASDPPAVSPRSG